MGSFVLAYIPKGTNTDLLTKLVNDGTSFISSSLPQDLIDFVEKKKIAELSQSHAENPVPATVTDIFTAEDSKPTLRADTEPPRPVSVEPSPSPGADSSFQAADLFIDDDEEEEYDEGEETNDQAESENPTTSSVSSSSVEIVQMKDIKEEMEDEYETMTPSISGDAPPTSSRDPFAFAAGKLEELANEMFRDPTKSSIPDITFNNESFSEKRKRGRPTKGAPRVYEGKPRGRPPSEPSNCHVCNAWFETFTLLMEHMAEHPGQKAFKCEVCHDQFTSRNGLKGHMRGIHYGDRPHACDVCWHTFVSANALRMHKNTHSKNKPYQCRECKRKFAQLGGMRAHRKKHHQPIEKAVGLM